MNEDWQQYRISVLQNIERLDDEVVSLKKSVNDQVLLNNDQKWINRALVVIGSIGGGAGIQVALKLLGLG